jgi:hypothetical protein
MQPRPTRQSGAEDGGTAGSADKGKPTTGPMGGTRRSAGSSAASRVILAPSMLVAVPAWLLWSLGAAIAVAAVVVLLNQRS